jgi:nitrogen regulatory protein PII
MNLSAFKKVTIIADDAMETYLIEEIKALGARGYTIEEAKGEGLHGASITDFQGRNIKIATIVSANTAEMILEMIKDKYLSQFSVIVYMSDVYVIRGERFM